jgi:hypothetical protein
VGVLTAKLEAARVAAAPPLTIPPGGEAVGTIVFESLDELLSGELPPPDVLIDDTLYAEGVHLASGHPGSGKSIVCLHWAFQVMAEGGHVVWLDYESGPRQTARRLKDMGIPASMAAELFHYAPFPLKVEDHLSAVAERWPGALVVLDSMSKGLAFAGIDENANAEVTQWTSKVVRACKDKVMPVVIIDHITKSGTDSDYSRGAGAKLADVDVHWRVLKVEDFNRSQSGIIQLKQKKDREGYLAFESYWSVGDGNGNLVLTETTGPTSDDAPQDPNGTGPAI